MSSSGSPNAVKNHVKKWIVLESLIYLYCKPYSGYSIFQKSWH